MRIGEWLRHQTYSASVERRFPEAHADWPQTLFNIYLLFPQPQSAEIGEHVGGGAGLGGRGRREEVGLRVCACATEAARVPLRARPPAVGQ